LHNKTLDVVVGANSQPTRARELCTLPLELSSFSSGEYQLNIDRPIYK